MRTKRTIPARIAAKATASSERQKAV